MSNARTAGGILATPVVTYMVVFFLAPSLLLFWYSFWTASSFRIVPDFVLTNYLSSLRSPLFLTVTWNAVVIGLVTAFVSVLLSIPVAYYLTYVTRSKIVFYVVLVTWFSSYLVRIYAWRTLLGTNGLLNALLLQTGIISKPIEAFLFSPFAVGITLVHIYLPFAILMVISAMSEIKKELIEASRDLGTGPIGAFCRVVAPNAAQGLIGAFMLTFILAASDYVTPQMVGGSDGQTTGLLIADQFRKTGNWPLGAAQAFLMFLISAIIYLVISTIARAAGMHNGKATALRTARSQQ